MSRIPTSLALFAVEEVFGSFKAVQKQHFDDGGTFDQIMSELHAGASH